MVRQLFVRFVSHSIPNLPNDPISIPSSLTRFGLSEIVNHLLARDPPTPFDFLIDHKLLRSSVESVLDSISFTEEQIVTVECVEMIPFPHPTTQLPHKDWISSVRCAAGSKRSGRAIITTTFDGNLQVWTKQKGKGDKGEYRMAVQTTAHTLPIKGCDVVETTTLPVVFTTSKDHTIKQWQLDIDRGECRAVCTFSGHSSSVDTIAVNGNTFASGSWDNTVKLWDLYVKPEGEETTKRQKTSEHGVTVTVPKATLTGHTQAVSGLAFVEPSALVSASWDHSLVMWDLNTTSHSRVMNGSQVIHSMSFSAHHSHVILTGDADNKIRIWDLRVEKGSVVSQTFSSHSAPVSVVKWVDSKGDGNSWHYCFASGSLDGTLKLWDVRGSIPLHTISPSSSDKVFACDWLGEGHVVAFGGAEGVVKLHSFDSK